MIALLSFNYHWTFSLDTILLLQLVKNSDMTPLTEYLVEGGLLSVVIFLTIMLQIPCLVPLRTLFAIPNGNHQVPEPINAASPQSFHIS